MSLLQPDEQSSDLNSVFHQLEANLALQQLLATLPDRTKRSVMVPFGSVAFFPGQLIHTNECFVDVGEVTTPRMFLDQKALQVS